jgi:outer membrane protein assembly factor BamB
MYPKENDAMAASRALCLCILGMLTLAALTASAADWPVWRGPNGDGVSTESGWTVPAGAPKVLWKQTVGIGFSSASVVGNRVYTMGNADGNDIVWCLDADTGKPVWSHKYPCKEGSYPGTRMTPTVDGDLVFTLSREGHLFCLAAKDGAVKWAKNVKKDFGVKNEPANWGLACSPLVVGDLLILDLGKVLALKKADGSLAWEAGKDVPGFGSPCKFAFGGKDYVTSFNASGLAIYELATQKEAARFEWKTKYDVNAVTPIVAGDKIFISSGYDRGCALLAFDGKSLKPVYENKAMRNHCNNCVLFKDYLYGIDGQHGSNGALKCMELATGKVAWTQSGVKPGGLMIADGKIIAMLDGGELLIAEAAPGAFKELARAKVLNEQCWTYPVLSGGRIYCRSNKEKELLCIDVSGK